jgi:hypothetical protein
MSALQSSNHRLNRDELINSVTDLFGADYVSDSTIQREFSNLQSEEAIAPYDSFSRGVTQGHIDSYFFLAQALAKKAVSTAALEARIFGACISTITNRLSCVRTFVNSFGTKLFRRPLTLIEIESFMQLFSSETDYKLGLEILLTAMAQSPYFLFQTELNGTDVADRMGLQRLTDYELATRLAFTVTGTTPDAALLAAASRGLLNTDTEFATQFDRLVATPRARLKVRKFFTRWLRLSDLPPESYSLNFVGPGIASRGLHAQMSEEFERFVEYIVFDKKGSYTDLMTSNISFARTADLAAIYQAPLWVVGQPPVTLTNQRQGLLNRAAFLASGGDAANPMKRGSRIRIQVLCEDLKRPESVPGLPPDALEEPLFDPTATTRHRYEVKTSPSACTACHSTINPSGFAFENFDSLGRFRETERIFSNGILLSEHPIDSTAGVPTSDGTVSVNGGHELARALASNRRAQACLARQWFRDGAGRLEDPVSDGCVLESMFEKLSDPVSGSLLEMFKAYVSSPAFKLRSRE